MSVSEYLQRARECAEIADRMKGADKAKLLEVAEAWASLAKAEAAKASGKMDGAAITLPLPNPPEPSLHR